MNAKALLAVVITFALLHWGPFPAWSNLTSAEEGVAVFCFLFGARLVFLLLGGTDDNQSTLAAFWQAAGLGAVWFLVDLLIGHPIATNPLPSDTALLGLAAWAVWKLGRAGKGARMAVGAAPADEIDITRAKNHEPFKPERGSIWAAIFQSVGRLIVFAAIAGIGYLIWQVAYG